jgi:outer membrane protein TolC
MGRQRELLAAAMNVSPDGPFCVVGDLYPLPCAGLDLPRIEAAALTNRPEVYQADLAHMSSLFEVRRLIVKFFPRVEGYMGYYRDENKFLFDRDWKEGGMRAAWDLMEFTATLFEHKAARAKFVKTDEERAVISLGILSQVRLKGLEAMSSVEKYKTFKATEEEARERLRIAGVTEEAKEKWATERIQRIAKQKALCDVLQAEIDRLKATGEAHASLAAVDTAVGTNYPVGPAR